jgi:hypothetical protein
VLDQVLPERVVSAEQLATQGTRPLFQVAIWKTNNASVTTSKSYDFWGQFFKNP